MDNILERIHKASLKLLEPLSTEDIYRVIVDEAIRLVGADYGSILLEREGILERVYASAEIAYQTKIRKKGNTYKAFKEKRPIIASITETGKAHPNVQKHGIRSTLFIPLAYKKQAIGVLTVNSYLDKTFTNKEMEIMRLFGSMVSLAIRKTQLYDESRQALETRDLFISIASHELRTPLTAVNGYIQLLHTRLSKSEGIESRWINQLAWESARLTNLVKELLEVEQIKTGNFQYSWKECSLKKVIDRALTDFTFTHPDREISFVNSVADKKDRVIGDFDKLMQVVTNIVDNAVKFSLQERAVKIILKNNSTNVIVAIQDQGSGIPKEDLPKIFQGFYKGKDNLVNGMGLGLYLSKIIIHEHHGDIAVRSALKRGTNVEIRLPRVKN